MCRWPMQESRDSTSESMLLPAVQLLHDKTTWGTKWIEVAYTVEPLYTKTVDLIQVKKCRKVPTKAFFIIVGSVLSEHPVLIVYV